MQLPTEFLRRFLGNGDLYCMESACNTWNIVCENTLRNPEVIILANVMLGPKSDFNLYVLMHYERGRKGTVMIENSPYYGYFF